LKANMRPPDMERDNARLRALLRIVRARFATAAPGDYLVTDDGDLDGPYPDIARAAKDCAADGLACTVVTVGGVLRPRRAGLAKRRLNPPREAAQASFVPR
jgi:hypothetical protein